MNAAQTRLEIRSEYVKIEDFESFLIAEVPYGQIDPRQLRQGIIERAGLDRSHSTLEWKTLADNAEAYAKLLHWQFGAEMCPIAAGLRFRYLYTSPYGQSTLGSLLIGYAAPRPGNAPAFTRDVRNDFHRIASSLEQSASSRFNDFLARNSPYPEDTAYSARDGDATHVELCGLARDNDSTHQLPYTWSDVATDPVKYGQLLHWTFGGTSYSLCKAIRVNYNEPHGLPALLIGYEAPGNN